MTPDESKDCVKFLLAGFPRESSFMSPEQAAYMLVFYASALQDLDYADVKRAMVRLARVSEKLPTVAAIRAAVVTTRSSKRRTGSEAWGDLRGLRTYRERAALDAFPDQLVLEICRSFDWIEWRTLWRGGQDIEQWHVVTGENESADRARFIDAYDQLATNTAREAQASQGARLAAPKVHALPGARADRDGGDARSIGEIVRSLPAPEGADDV